MGSVALFLAFSRQHWPWCGGGLQHVGWGAGSLARARQKRRNKTKPFGVKKGQACPSL